jgi:hypothetical protein
MSNYPVLRTLVLNAVSFVWAAWPSLLELEFLPPALEVLWEMHLREVSR